MYKYYIQTGERVNYQPKKNKHQSITNKQNGLYQLLPSLAEGQGEGPVIFCI